MDAMVAFFEKLVSEFSWKRLVFVVSALFLALVSLWGYEAFTGRFRSERMQFAAEHLAKLADPELKKNVQGDEDLEKAHKRMKVELNRFLETSQLNFGVPEPVLKGLAAAAPWLLLGVILFFATAPSDRGNVVGGLLVVSIPLVLIGVLLPSFEAVWINYLGYPLGMFLVVMGGIVLWQRQKSSQPKVSTVSACEPALPVVHGVRNSDSR